MSLLSAGPSWALALRGSSRKIRILEKILLSRFGLSFLKAMPETFDAETETGFVEGGYLILAGAGGEPILRRNHKVQTELGADILWLDPSALQNRFPWLRVDDLRAGTLGLSGEGWFDAHLMLPTLRQALKTTPSVQMITARAEQLMREGQRITSVRLDNGTVLTGGTFVNACGPKAQYLMHGLSVGLPVEPRKRCGFYIEVPDRLPGLPLLCDPSGFYIRPEEHGFICSIPPENDTAVHGDFSVDYDLFGTTLWPALAHRIPALERLRQIHAWAGHYEYNTFDQNAILGPHPELGNLLFINSFSGHGLQHGPGVGRALSEWIVYGQYRTINLSLFSYDRLLTQNPVVEENVI